MRFQYIQVHSGPLPQYTVDFNYFFSKILCFMNGALAQLGERLTGSQEVRGSTPLISTNTKLPLFKIKRIRGGFLFYYTLTNQQHPIF